MSSFYFLLIGVSFVLFLSCKEQTASVETRSEDTFKPKGDMSDLVHNPVRLDGSIDSSFLPILSWKDTVYAFGTVNEGDVVTRSFSFTNTGTAPLVILQATSTCGCTIPSWPKSAILPDSSGVVEVKFNTEYRTGSQLKEVTIFANTFPNQSRIRLSGRVIKK